MFDNFSKVYVPVEDLAVRIMHVDPDRLLFMFDERIFIFLKTDSFYIPSVKTPKMAANPLKKTEIRRYTTEIPAFQPFFQRYGWTLCVLSLPLTSDEDCRLGLILFPLAHTNQYTQIYMFNRTARSNTCSSK